MPRRIGLPAIVRSKSGDYFKYCSCSATPVMWRVWQVSSELLCCRKCELFVAYFWNHHPSSPPQHLRYQDVELVYFYAGGCKRCK